MDEEDLEKGNINGIQSFVSDDPKEYTTLTQAVNFVERLFVSWLQKLGCEVRFG